MAETLRARAARTGKVIRALAHASLALTLQYRLEALGEIPLSMLSQATSLVPLFVVFGARPEIDGWTRPEMLLVIAWFTLLKAFLEGTINPSLLAVIGHVRQGTLDFVLLKPADAQLLVSFSKLEPSRIVDLTLSFVLFGWAFRQLHRIPSPLEIAAALFLLVAALAVLYSLAILVISIAFIAVRVDNLLYLFTSVFDLARWPSTIFHGGLAILFTYVLPLSLMTTYPALALLGKLHLSTALGALGGALAFAILARATWLSSLRRYTSASS